MREFRPIPDPSGALEPPDRRPPTAVGAATPEPDPAPVPRRPVQRRAKRPRLEAVLDVVLGIPLELMQIAYKKVRRRRTRA